MVRVCTYHDDNAPEENTALLVTPLQREGYLLCSQILCNRKFLDEKVCRILAHQDTNVENRACSVLGKLPESNDKLTQPVILVSIKAGILLDAHNGTESQRSFIE